MTRTTRNDCMWRMPRPTAQQVGANLQTAIDQAGLSQREFASRLGIHPSTFNRIIAGTIRMNVTTLIDAAELLGVEPCTLLRGDPTPCGGQS